MKSAEKHGQQNSDISRAIRLHLKCVFESPRPNVVTVIGPNVNGLIIEVMIDIEQRASPVVFHAMPISERRQRELLGG